MRGGEIKGPTTAQAGSTIEVVVQGDAPFIEVTLQGSTETTTFPVPPGKAVQIPVPANSGGRYMLIVIKGGRPRGSHEVLITSSD